MNQTVWWMFGANIEPDQAEITVYQVDCPTLCNCSQNCMSVIFLAYHISEDDLDLCKNECTFRTLIPCEDADIYYMCINIMAVQNLALPGNAYDALNLYTDLRDHLRHFVSIVCISSYEV
jgi:hypothetical protein